MSENVKNDETIEQTNTNRRFGSGSTKGICDR